MTKDEWKSLGLHASEPDWRLLCFNGSQYIAFELRGNSVYGHHRFDGAYDWLGNGNKSTVLTLTMLNPT